MYRVVERVATYIVLAIIVFTLASIYVFQTTYSIYSSLGDGRVVFSMEDPVGDDNGTGNYTYPTNSVFQPGVFDMTNFTVVDNGDTVLFMASIVNLGDNPWNGPNGFCLQYFQIYVLTTLPVDPNRTTIGANVVIEPGWHFALLLAPGWGDTPVPVGERAALYYYNGSFIEQNGLFTVYVEGNTIIASVHKSILPDTEFIDWWGYAVLLTSYDGYGPMKVRPIQPGDPGEWVFGGGDPEAIAAGVEPRVIDILAETADEQYLMLNSYDPSTGERAKVFAVIPSVTTPTSITITVSPPTTPFTNTTSPSPNTTPTTSSPLTPIETLTTTPNTTTYYSTSPTSPTPSSTSSPPSNTSSSPLTNTSLPTTTTLTPSKTETVSVTETLTPTGIPVMMIAIIVAVVVVIAIVVVFLVGRRYL